ncbi:chromosomal replication initiation ATPase DnaA [Rhizomicrobium palustre]|uniref:Chromosomal replication initiation ATPase DnaA n=1 Tax=Rhizomicrobium palustre TaxID=189966 RepID=A0A846MV86_9PROT|nr:hypothetical protein [Rhizomicrobium palustre]NIK86980.1 chromosomal replication initiation ATPase DnaA [Rhizomicrobium palustre]
MSFQIPLPLPARARLGRSEFITGPGNAAAVALIDTWPAWPAPAAVLYGPSGSGKSHLAGVWAEKSGAVILYASDLVPETLTAPMPLVIEGVDEVLPSPEIEQVLFAFLERGHSLILTAHTPPSAWKNTIPDLRSRFDALLAFPLWEPDDALLQGLAKKLFADRQLQVPDSVIAQMIRALERSPAAVRDFVAKADEAALAEKKPVTLGLIRSLLAKD